MCSNISYKTKRRIEWIKQSNSKRYLVKYKKDLISELLERQSKKDNLPSIITEKEINIIFSSFSK